MPHFFVPHADDAAQAERVWQATKKFMESQGYEILERRIYAISYSHNRVNRRDIVGQVNTVIGEEILVILEAANVFLGCTKNRGVLRGEPLMIGKHWDTSATDFAAEAAAL